VRCERLIRRYEHNYFRGWVVSTKRRGRRWTKYFSDKPRGRAAAHRRAREYRDELLAQLPPAIKVKRTYIRNTTGEIGVALVREHTRAGSSLVRYVASWPTRVGAPMKATFSVGLYGEVAAKQHAIQARRRGLRELLLPAGRCPRQIRVAACRPKRR
jgi:AP2 domain